jgi:DNA topoisomerase-1
MEETGVGRPSTYAPTISTILDREYVVKEGRYLRPTTLGEVVTALMKERFTDIVDLKFTARLEESLDSVEKGVRDWKSLLGDFYAEFDASLKTPRRRWRANASRYPTRSPTRSATSAGGRWLSNRGALDGFWPVPDIPNAALPNRL